MKTLELVRWVLLNLSVIYLITTATIASPFRMALAKRSKFLQSLIYCPACVGFWIGLAFYGYWPLDGQVLGAVQSPTVYKILESGAAAMALGAIWANWAGNPAFAIEVHDRELDESETEDEPNE